MANPMANPKDFLIRLLTESTDQSRHFGKLSGTLYFQLTAQIGIELDNRLITQLSNPLRLELLTWARIYRYD